MVTPTAARVSWLLGDDAEKRECYALHKAKPAEGQREPFGLCMYCNTGVSPFGNGAKTAMAADIRDRGTDWQNKETRFIHKGCIPPPGDWKPQRIRARAMNASAVRATVGDKE